MEVRRLMLDQYQKEWNEIVAKYVPHDLQFYNDYGLDFENMEEAFTLNEVQVYVDDDIENSGLPDRENYHIMMLSKLARLYANTVFLMLRDKLNIRSYALDKEAFYDKAIDTLKKRYNNSTAYPCNNSNRKPISANSGGDVGGFTNEDNLADLVLNH